MEESLKFIFDNASKFFDDGNYASAEPLLHQLVLKNLKNAKLFYMLGAIQYQKNDVKKALRSFKRSLEIDPSFTDSGIGLSVVYNDLGHYSEGQQTFMDAKKHLKSPSQLKSENTRHKVYLAKHIELAKLYNDDKNYSETLQNLIKAKSFSEEPTRIQILISECLLNMKEYQKAINELNSVLTKDPHHTPALMRLGQIYNLLGHHNSAIKAFERILLSEPNHTAAAQRLNHLRQRQQNYQI